MNLLIGISGGIAAYKVPELIRRFCRAGVDCRVILTTAAEPLVGAESLCTLTGSRVYKGNERHEDIDHIRLSEWADHYLICPATANTIAKCAAGIADNLVTTTVLSFSRGITFAPAMNHNMWEKEVTKANIQRLREYGMRVLPVDQGELACGTSGKGRLLPLEEIVDSVLYPPESDALYNKKVVVSSGPTHEYIDPVRIITNRSSGRMGAVFAGAAVRMGAEVKVVSGPVSIEYPCSADVTNVISAEEMGKALSETCTGADILIMAAAVSDFTPVDRTPEKISRDSGSPPVIKMRRNPDILREVKKNEKGIFAVGFSLEQDPGEKSKERAVEKMAQKGSDLTVFNTVDSSLERDSAEIELLFPDGSTERFPEMDKKLCAEKVLERVVSLISKKG
ncbi:MAG: bifunctional phosphopantothenoylcysteine decarboxylase/phosphopantothenate--cysteine ligase CoaBC [Chitinivibrionales bacterium]